MEIPMDSILRCSSCKELLGDYSVHTEYYKLLENNDKIGVLGGFICHKCAIKESDIKKLYHASIDCDTIKEFSPRIPEFRAWALDEDASIPRISLCDSIEGCLSAAPWGGSNFENLFWERGSCLIRIYEFDINGLNLDNLLPPEYLYSEDLVRDSYVSREYWYINEKLVPSRSYLIEVDNYDIRWADMISFDDYVRGMYADRAQEDFDWAEVIGGHISEICFLEYHIVPEERRSGVFRLNHRIEMIGDKDYSEVETEIIHEFPTTRTWVDFEEKEDGIYLIGELDTRMCFEIDKEKIIDFLNEKIGKKGKIIKQ